jgi:ribonuclease HI
MDEPDIATEGAVSESP